MIYAIDNKVESKKIFHEISFSEKITTINIPEGWWFSLSTFEIIKPRRQVEIIKIPRAYPARERARSLPMTNYWEIQHGDYRSRAEKSKMINRRRNKKIFDTVTLSVMVIISTVMVIALSYLISNVG